MIHLGLRVAAGALIASAFTLLVCGSHATLIETRLMFFAWGLLFGNAGIALTACLFLRETTRDESDRNARKTADAVGQVVGGVLTGDDPDVTRLR